MNKFKEICVNLKEKYMKLNPVVREIIETVVFVVVMIMVSAS